MIDSPNPVNPHKNLFWMDRRAQTYWGRIFKPLLREYPWKELAKEEGSFIILVRGEKFFHRSAALFKR